MRNETSGDLISRSALLEPYEMLVSGLKDSNNGTVAGFVKAITKHIKLAPAVDAVEVGSCDGCHWKEIGRQQKCSCCRRNRYLKDCYEAKMEG